MTHAIRPAREADLDAVAELWRAFMADQGRYLKTVRLTKANRARLRAHLGQLAKHGQVLVLDEAGAIRGYAAVVVNLPPLDGFYASASLSDLYVAPECRGRGFGRALLEAATAMAGERGLHAVTLQVASGNEAARALYRACGFQTMTETMILPLVPGYVRFGPAHPHEGENR